MSAWRLLETWDASPALAMGLDEALLEDPGAPPTLRLYTWSPDTLSLGYFQRFADVPAAARAGEPGGPGAVVRRITGGGAIHHVRELTFSIAVARGHPLYRGPVAESYARVHGAIAAALAELGLEARLRGDEGLASDVPATGMCFHASTPLDLAWGGRKGVGSAQRRRAGRILHHGSIKLGTSPLDTGVATVGGEGAPIAPRAFARVLVAAFRSVLGLALEPGELGEGEVREGERRGQRYLDPGFVRRR